MNKLFLDTKSSSYHNWAIDLISKPFDLYTSSKNLSEYFAVVTKGENPLITVLEAIKDLVEIQKLCNIVYPSEESYKKLISLLLKYQPKGLLLHDFEIASIALVNDINSISTVNRRDFKRIEEVKLITP